MIIPDGGHKPLKDGRIVHAASETVVFVSLI